MSREIELAGVAAVVTGLARRDAISGLASFMDAVAGKRLTLR